MIEFHIPYVGNPSVENQLMHNRSNNAIDVSLSVWIILCCLCCCWYPLRAQMISGNGVGTAAVRGSIVDALSNKVVSGVQVKLSSSNQQITTTSTVSGEFVFASVAAGTYQLQCFMLGYETFSQELTIANGDISPAALSVVCKLIPQEVELADLLNIVIVTATKSEKKSDDVPSMVDVLTREQIHRRGYRHLADVLNDIVHNHQDRGNWGIGEPLYQNVGFGLRFDTGQNMLLLFNGQRLNAFLPGNRFGGEEYLPDNIERIEIVRGPGSALYGANAFTLVVNIITKQSFSDGEQGFVRIRPQGIASPYSEGIGYGGSVAFGAPLGTVGTVISGSVQGLTDPGQTILVRNTLFGDAVLTDRIGHALSGNILLRHEGFRVFAQFTNQSRNTMTGFNGISPRETDDIGRHLTLSMYSYSLGADYLWNMSETTSLKFSAGWHQDNWTEIARIPLFKTTANGSQLLYDAAGLPVLDTVSIPRMGRLAQTPFPIDGQGGDSRTLEAEVQFTWNFTPTNTMIVGINAIEDRVISAVRPTEIQLSPTLQFIEFARLTDDANIWLFDPRASRLTLGIYAQADYDIAPGLSVNAGARVDMYSGTGVLSEQQYTEFNPRGGAVYKHQEAGIFKLSYGRAMRVPNGFEALSSVTILGNPSLRPERIEMLQFVWIKDWSPHIRSEIGGFTASVSNRLVTDAAIQEDLKAQGFVGQFINVAETVRQRTNGIDAKCLVRAGAVDILLNATQYIGTDDGSGEPLPYIPMTMVNANVNIPVDWLNINCGAHYRGSFSRPGDGPRAPVPAYLLATLTLNAHPFPELPVEIQAGARNLLNSMILAPSSSRDFPEHFRTRGQEFWLAFRLRL